MTWQEVQDLLAKTELILVPIGSLEQHGPHLPLGTDTVLASEIAGRAASKADVPLSPAIPVGFSIEHMNFPGTISLNVETMMRIVKEISESLIRHGFRKILYVNAHGGNSGILQSTMQLLKHDHKAIFCLANIWELAKPDYKNILESKAEEIGHADEFETSMLLAIDENKVRSCRIASAGHMKIKTIHPFTTASMGWLAWKAEDYSKTGVIGDPRKALKKKGDQLLNKIVDRLVDQIEEIRKMQIT